MKGNLLNYRPDLARKKAAGWRFPCCNPATGSYHGCIGLSVCRDEYEAHTCILGPFLNRANRPVNAWTPGSDLAARR